MSGKRFLCTLTAILAEWNWVMSTLSSSLRCCWDNKFGSFTHAYHVRKTHQAQEASPTHDVFLLHCRELRVRVLGLELLHPTTEDVDGYFCLSYIDELQQCVMDEDILTLRV